jgi:hypothetical protein
LSLVISHYQFTILNVKRYPPVSTEEGLPIEENIRIMEQAIREKIEQENKKAN